MNAHTNHPDWDALNEFADGSMPQQARADVAHHLDTCAECRDTVARVRALRDSATSLPRSVEPPPAVWANIAAKIDETKVVDMSGAARGVHDAASSNDIARRTARRRLFQMVAAAVVLIAVSSGVTALLMPARDPFPAVATNRDTGTNARLASLPVEVRTVEQTYLATVGELVAVLDDPSNGLSPQTIRSVQRSLAVIDAAITEARQALLGDPASVVLREMFARTYQQKVELLRRASAHVGT